VLQAARQCAIFKFKSFCQPAFQNGRNSFGNPDFIFENLNFDLTDFAENRKFSA